MSDSDNPNPNPDDGVRKISNERLPADQRKSFVAKFEDVFEDPISVRARQTGTSGATRRAVGAGGGTKARVSAAAAASRAGGTPVSRRYGDVEQRPVSATGLPAHAIDSREEDGSAPADDDIAAERQRAEEREDDDDLHPETVQMLARMPSLLSRGLIYAIILFVVVAIIWAAVSETDVVVKGNSIVVPEGPVEQVASQINGVVEELHVEEGAIVKQGDVLMTLSARDLEAEAAEMSRATFEQEQADAALKRFEVSDVPRLQAQRDAIAKRRVSVDQLIQADRDLLETLTTEQQQKLVHLQADIKEQTAKFDVYAADLAAQLARLDAEIARGTVEAEAAVEAEQRLRLRVDLQREDMERKRRNFEQGVDVEAPYTAARLAYLQAQDELEGVREAAASLPHTIKALEAQKSQATSANRLQVGEVEREIARLSYEVETLPTSFNKQRETLVKSISESQAQLAALDLELTQLVAAHEQQQERLTDALASAGSALSRARERQRLNEAARTIVAPIDGVITTLAIRQTGEFVQTGQKLATIAAEDATMVAEITVANKDIGGLEAGMPVKLKFHAFPYQDYGVSKGEILSVAPDAVIDEELGPVFRVRASFQLTPTRRTEDLDIRYGFTADAEVVQRTRTLLDIMLDPFSKISEQFAP